MNKRQRKVLALLKTRTKALGFNRKELEGLAQKIDKNLELEENASDEDEDAAIENAVDAAIPFLEVSQSAAQRSTQKAIQKFKDSYNIDDQDQDGDGDDTGGEGDGDGEPDQNRNSKRQVKQKKNIEESEMMKLIKAVREELGEMKGQISSLKGDRVADARRSQLEKLVKNTGTFGKSVLKQFALMNFKDDESFEDYLEDVQKDLDDLNQERANEGLKKLGEVPSKGGQKGQENNKPEVLSDESIIELAGGVNSNN